MNLKRIDKFEWAVVLAWTIILIYCFITIVRNPNKIPMPSTVVSAHIATILICATLTKLWDTEGYVKELVSGLRITLVLTAVSALYGIVYGTAWWGGLIGMGIAVIVTIMLLKPISDP